MIRRTPASRARLAENPGRFAVSRGEVLAAHRVDQVVDGRNALEGPGDGCGIERVAGGDLGGRRGAAAQGIGPADEATQRHAAPFELRQQPAADVSRSAGQKDAARGHGTDTTRAEQGLAPILR